MRSTLTLVALAGTLGLLLCGEASAQRGYGNRGGNRPNAYPGYNSGFNSGYNNYGGNRGVYSNGSNYGFGSSILGLGFGNQQQYYNTNRSNYQSSPYYSYPSQGTTYYTTPGVTYSTPTTVYTPSTTGTVYQSTTTSVPMTMPATGTTGRAIIDVTVPTADAQVMFGTTLMDLEGRERRYESTEINLGQSYTYTITARWMNDGRLMEQVKKVEVMAGRTSNANFRNDDAKQLPAPEPTHEK